MVEAVGITEQHLVRNYLDIINPFTYNGMFSQEQFDLAIEDAMNRLGNSGLLSQVDDEGIKREFSHWVDNGYVEQEELKWHDQDGNNNPLWRTDDFNIPVSRAFHRALEEANVSLNPINRYALRGALHDAIIEARFKRPLSFVW